jgi:hypothetical protein
LVAHVFFYGAEPYACKAVVSLTLDFQPISPKLPLICILTSSFDLAFNGHTETRCDHCHEFYRNNRSLMHRCAYYVNLYASSSETESDSKYIFTCLNFAHYYLDSSQTANFGNAESQSQPAMIDTGAQVSLPNAVRRAPIACGKQLHPAPQAQQQANVEPIRVQSVPVSHVSALSKEIVRRYSERTALRPRTVPLNRWISIRYRQRMKLRKALKEEWRFTKTVIAVDRQTGKAKLITKKRSK